MISLLFTNKENTFFMVTRLSRIQCFATELIAAINKELGIKCVDCSSSSFSLQLLVEHKRTSNMSSFTVVFLCFQACLLQVRKLFLNFSIS